jgi:hypothetical protein
MKAIRRTLRAASDAVEGVCPANSHNYGPESEHIIHHQEPSSQKGPSNRELFLDDFLGFSANLYDRRGMQIAGKMVDKFVEVKYFNDIDFKTIDFRALYECLFPNKDEAEPFDDVIRRVGKMRRLDEGDPEVASQFGRTRYHVIAALNKGRVIGFTLFSTVALDDGRMLVYSQYAGLADKEFMKDRYGSDEQFRSKGLLYLAYPLMQGLALEYGRKFGAREVIGVINESEMIGQGQFLEEIAFSKIRLDIFNRNGVKVMMARTPDGRLITPHVQPNLVEGTNPIYLHLAFRPLRFDLRGRDKVDELGKEEAKILVKAIMDVFEAEDFAPEALKAARREALGRVENAEKILLLPPSELPDMVALARMDPALEEQVIHDYGSLEAQEMKICASLAFINQKDRSFGE